MKLLDVVDQSPDEEGTITKNKPKKGFPARGFKRQVESPSKYAVILHNDDYTPMEFVVYVLQEIFHHPFDRAERIMLSVHNEGMGVAGIYHFEIAEQKAYDTAEEAQGNQYPLKVTIEELT